MRILVACILMLALAGCQIPGIGNCDQEAVEVTMNGGVLGVTPPQSVNLRSQVSESNIPTDFAALKGVVQNTATSQGPDELLWDLSQGLPLQGFASFALAVPTNQGQTITLNNDFALRGAGWGIRFTAPPKLARAGLQIGNFTADTVSGTIVVIGTNPLALRVNLQFSDEDETIGLSGDMRFRAFTIDQTCD